MSEEEKKNYSADSIQALEGMEHVRMRPSMYIGDVGVRGLHHLVYEVIDNSIDEALAGHCDTISVWIKDEKSPGYDNFDAWWQASSDSGLMSDSDGFGAYAFASGAAYYSIKWAAGYRAIEGSVYPTGGYENWIITFPAIADGVSRRMNVYHNGSEVAFLAPGGTISPAIAETAILSLPFTKTFPTERKELVPETKTRSVPTPEAASAVPVVSMGPNEVEPSLLILYVASPRVYTGFSLTVKLTPAIADPLNASVDAIVH